MVRRSRSDAIASDPCNEFNENSQMEKAVETGMVQPRRILFVCAARLVCTLATSTLYSVQARASDRINARVRRARALQSFADAARLDVPTSERPAYEQSRMTHAQECMFGTTLLWGTVHSMFDAVNSAVQVGAQSFVLLNVLRGQRDTALMGALPLVTELFSLARTMGIAPQKGELFSPSSRIV